MKKQQEQKEIVDIDEFDNSISLYQLIPSGTGKAQRHLQQIVDAHFNSQKKRNHNKPLSLLIVGGQGKRTHAYAFLRALGLNLTEEIPSVFLNKFVCRMLTRQHTKLKIMITLHQLLLTPGKRCSSRC